MTRLRRAGPAVALVCAVSLLAACASEATPSRPATSTSTSTSTTPLSTVSALPRLHILHPRSGDVVQAPFAVEYEISNGPPEVGIRLTVDDADGFALDLSVDAQSGVVSVNDKRLSGHRTLVFTLVDAAQQPLNNPEATVRVPDVIIEGGR